jgi:hypothetical protein
MPRDLTAYLQDILDAAAAIADVMRAYQLRIIATLGLSDRLSSENSSLLARRCDGSAIMMNGSSPQSQIRGRSLISEICWLMTMGL